MANQINGRVHVARSESRAQIRFPLQLELRYSVADPSGSIENGSGRTIDISSVGLSFTAERPLAMGQMIDLSIDWPVRLDGDVQLQLVVSGVVVRTSGTVTGLRIGRHEFRTRRAAVTVTPPQRVPLPLSSLP